jgi:hypothetical protein
MTGAVVPAAVRRQVIERAGGQCEYCLTPASIALIPHEVDHIIAQKHGGANELDNLAYACALCNQYKGTDIASLDPDTGALAPLYNPRRDRWRHQFDLREAVFVPLTAIGRVTVRLLRLNAAERVAERTILLAADLLRLPE